MNIAHYNDPLHNAIRTSELDAFNDLTTFKNVAAKFVLSGKETYYIKNKKFEVKSGEYIIGNNNQLSEVLITEKTLGLCVDISNELISEVLESMFENPDFAEFLLSDHFLVNKYNSSNTTLGYRLRELSKNLLSNHGNPILNTELFYSIGENVVIDQAIIFEQISKLNYKNQFAGEDVFRNLLKAKDFIDDCFLEVLDLEQITQIAFMSKYAFIRLFKLTFGTTPYHYLIQKRLLFARDQIINGTLIADVALQTHFADTPSFSKAFKSHFGYPPSRLQK